MCKNRIIYNFNLTQVAVDAIVKKKRGNIFEMHLLGIIENVL